MLSYAGLAHHTCKARRLHRLHQIVNFGKKEKEKRKKKKKEKKKKKTKQKKTSKKVLCLF